MGESRGVVGSDGPGADDTNPDGHDLLPSGEVPGVSRA
jgi:hypothetical protein